MAVSMVALYTLLHSRVQGSVPLSAPLSYILMHLCLLPVMKPFMEPLLEFCKPMMDSFDVGRLSYYCETYFYFLFLRLLISSCDGSSALSSDPSLSHTHVASRASLFIPPQVEQVIADAVNASGLGDGEVCIKMKEWMNAIID